MIPPKTLNVYVTNKKIIWSIAPKLGPWAPFIFCFKNGYLSKKQIFMEIQVATLKLPSLTHFRAIWPQIFCIWKLRPISLWSMIIFGPNPWLWGRKSSWKLKNWDFKVPKFSGSPTLRASRSDPKNILDLKHFWVSCQCHYLDLHTPWPPLCTVFQGVRVEKVMGGGGNRPPPHLK